MYNKNLGKFWPILTIYRRKTVKCGDCNARYTPPTPTRPNYRVELRRRCVLNSQLVHDGFAFALPGPRAWNSLPDSVRQSSSLDVFKRLLKTHLFSRSFNHAVADDFFKLTVKWPLNFEVSLHLRRSTNWLFLHYITLVEILNTEHVENLSSRVGCKIGNWVTTADGWLHTARHNSTRLNVFSFQFLPYS